MLKKGDVVKVRNHEKNGLGEIIKRGKSGYVVSFENGNVIDKLKKEDLTFIHSLIVK